MDKIQLKQKRKWPICATFMLIASLLFYYTGYAFAQGSTDLGAVANNITGTLENLAKLVTAGSYVAGFGFAVGAILKFKAHKDNPTQIPVGTPIALVFIAAALIFLPTIFGVVGETMFKSTSGVGGVKGTTTLDGGSGGGSAP